jgi:hypothetical protein
MTRNERERTLLLERAKKLVDHFSRKQ